MLRWIRDLNRRRVPHVAGVYVVVGFGLLQAADLIFPRLGLPDWTVTLVLALLALGLPVAMVLAWAYELTPDGISRTEAAAPGSPPPAPPAPNRGARTAVTAAVGAVAGMLLAGLYLNRPEAPPPVLSESLVAVAPFRVSGAATASYLEEGMIDLLAAKLTGAGGLRAVEPRTVLAAWRAQSGRDVRGSDGGGESGAREVARRLGAGRLLLGSVVATGDRLHLAARILDTAAGHDLARHEIHGPADSLPWLVDRFTAGLLAGLGGTDPQQLMLLEGTPLPALRAYLDGQTLLRAGWFEDARDAFGRAIAEDSTFALAGIFHTIAAGFTSQWSTTGSRLAWRHRHKLAPRDRVLLNAQLGPNFPEWSGLAARVEALEQATRALADRAEVWYLHGDQIYHHDIRTPVRDRLERAARSFRTATELDPGFGPATMHLFEIALFQGDTAQARRIGTRFLAAELAGELAGYIRWFMDRLDGVPAGSPGDAPFHPFHLLAGQLATQHAVGLDAADTLIDWGVERASDAHRLVLLGASQYLFERGRPERALQLWQERLGATPPELAFVTAYAQLYGEAGLDPESVRGAVATLDAIAWERQDMPGFRWVDAACVAGQAHAANEQLDRARDHAAALHEVVERASRRADDGSHGHPMDDEEGGDGGEDPQTPTTASVRNARTCSALIDAMVAVYTGADGSREAVARLDRYHADGAAASTWLRDAASIVLADLYRRRGEPEHALDATRRRVVGVPNVHFVAGQLRIEGWIAAELGRTDEAIQAWSHYVRLREGAEPGAAALADEVRVRLAELHGPG
jgi:tetratricopeptide (TPR) repeat protein/TolB-like protein